MNNPTIPLGRIIGLINMDSVGAGDKLAARGAKNFPEFWKIIEEKNQKYLHEIVQPELSPTSPGRETIHRGLCGKGYLQ